jgi:hypothetical protein
MLLRPRESHGLRILSSTLAITPDANLRWHRDALDNSVAIASFSGECSYLRIESRVVVEQQSGDSPLDFLLADFAVMYPFGYHDAEAAILSPFLTSIWPDDRAHLESWLAGLGLQAGAIETFVLLDRMNRTIHESFRYAMREEFGVQSPAQTLTLGAGSCRDFATLLMEACRHLGLASRFVSGYLHVASDGSVPGATHAWAEVYLPGAGWRGFDPTLGTLAGADHIAVAVAHHPEHVAPVAGSFVGTAGLRPAMHVSVRVVVLR